MPEIDAERATRVARSALGLGDDIAANVWRIERLDAPERGYVLVVFGTPQASMGVATVSSATGDLNEWARLPGTRGHLTVDADAARRLVDLGADASARLAWQPCPFSRSPLYPFWIVQATGSTRYVDLRGQVWSSLEPAERGGGYAPSD